MDSSDLSDADLRMMLCSGPGITQEFKLGVDGVFRNLCNKPDVNGYIFPQSLTSEQRRYIHEKCRKMRMKSKSVGNEPERKLQIYKSSQVYSKIFRLRKNEGVSHAVQQFMSNYEKDSKNYLADNKKSKRSPQSEQQVFDRLSTSRAETRSSKQSRFMEFRMQLPVWTEKENILQLISYNQVTIITSETGSGKTTQIPQFILENACMRGTYCKIICTQPRRLSTVAVAERVAAERGENLGDVVGYQIKLKCVCNPRTALMYCTNGVLLRTLMNNSEQYLKNITHIIVDEVHERDKYTDFLLIHLKQCLNLHPDLRVVLMSATADVNLFMSYFQTQSILHIPGKLFPIYECFLEDILVELDYGKFLNTDKVLFAADNKFEAALTNETYNNDCAKDMDNVVQDCIEFGNDNSFTQLMHLILSEDCSVNHQTSQGFTPLMAAATHGNYEVVRQLLNLGARTDLVSREKNRSAEVWARYYEKHEVAKLINNFSRDNSLPKYEDNISLLLENYCSTISDDAIDFVLILRLIKYIHNNDKCGTILVFLPGYDDIITCQQKILTSDDIDINEFQIFMLHGSMDLSLQRSAFKELKNQHKIILSTNIAETSITIADVRYVIDSGKAKEKSYDSLSGTCSLQKVWISKASVKQRAGRAGRTQIGRCFHIFSKNRYRVMLNNHVAEILRVPLHELCLQTKLLAPQDVKIAEYLELALEPPPTISVETSIQSLQTLGALDEKEELTLLGQHLVQFSVEPRLGKMLIYAAIFKCLDPILTIVACLSHKEPFILPQQPKMKQLAIQKQKELGGNSLSDHFTLLRAFQLWQEVQGGRQVNDLVQNHFISPSAMETIHGTRAQLLSQLRAAGFVSLLKSNSVQNLNSNSNEWSIVKAALAVGCYPNIAFLMNDSFATRKEKKIIFNKTSIVNSSATDKKTFAYHDYCVAYEELTSVGKSCSIKCGTVLTPLTIALVCGDQSEELEKDNNLAIDGWLGFQHEYENFNLFRQIMKIVIHKKIENPQYMYSAADEDALNVLSKILSMEDYQCEMPQPSGVGRVPNLFLNIKSTSSKQQLHDMRAKNPQWRQRSSSYLQNNSLDWRRRSSSTNPENNSHEWRHRPENHDLSDWRQRNSNPVNHLSHKLLNGLNVTKAAHNGYSDSCGFINEGKIFKSHIYAASSSQTPSVLNSQYSEAAGSSSEVLLNALKKSSAFTNQNQAQNCSDIVPVKHFKIPGNAVFFVIKPPDFNNLAMGMNHNSWKFSPLAEKKIFKFILQGYCVILFFTVAKSYEFQGLARLLSTNNGDVNQPCNIQWLSLSRVKYERVRTKHILNEYNHFKWVFQCNDGQEVDFNAGEQLCNLFFEEDPNDASNLGRPILGGFSNEYVFH